MTAKGKNKMFTAERLAQILLAILMVATALVILLNKPANNDVTVKSAPMVKDTISVAAPDSTKLEVASKDSKPSKKVKDKKVKKKTDTQIRHRDHLREPMTVTE